MKQVFTGCLFLFISVINVSAQEEDTVKVVNTSMIMSPFNDSLRLNTNIIKSSADIPGYGDIDVYSPPFASEQLVIGQKKTNILNAPYSKFIIPAALISYGLIAQECDRLQELDHSIHQKVSEHFTNRIRLDDYTPFVPAAAVYGLDFMGIKAKHNFRDRTFLMTTSYLLMLANVQTLKRITKTERPDGSNFRSFPSGHTATTFFGAHILFKEYKDISPWIGIAGYVVASGTGVMRVYNKKHWASDVVAGAGIGILSVEIGYLLLPVFHNVLGIKNNPEGLIIAPVVGNNNYGVGLAFTF